MKFADLEINMIARIPLAINDLITNPTRAIPPAVEILSTPTQCPDGTCDAYEVMTCEFGTGLVRLAHRLPERSVIHITPALEAT